jgi:hypothetical protein
MTPSASHLFRYLFHARRKDLYLPNLALSSAVTQNFASFAPYLHLNLLRHQRSLLQVDLIFRIAPLSLVKGSKHRQLSHHRL